jgi:hypothetical protein
MKIPSSIIWNQPNNGDRAGSIWSSFNLKLSEEIGKLKIGPRLMINTSSAYPITEADFTSPPPNFKKNPRSTGNWYTLSGSYVFVGTTVPNGNFTQDTATSTPSLATDRPDLEIFNSGASGGGFIYVVDSDIYKLASNAASWSTINPGSDQAKGPLLNYKQRLYFVYGGDYNVIGSMDTSDTTAVSYTLSLLGYDSYAVSCYKATSAGIFVGTISQNESTLAKVYLWDGITANTLSKPPIVVDATAVYAMTVKEDTPWIMDSNGVLRAYNGATFIEKARLPIKKGRALKQSLTDPTARFIHYNGMFTRGKSIFLFINGQYSDSTAINGENVSSGVWEYTEENGLHHVGSLSNWVSASTTTATDYGAAKVSTIGAMVDCTSTDTTSTTNGDIMIGARYFTDATTTQNAIWINDSKNTLQKAGYFVTPKLFSSDITDAWQKMTMRFKKFLDSSNKAVIKYRTTEQIPFEVTLTWASTTTFNTTTDLRSYIGYEVEVLNGIGAGKVAHITTSERGELAGNRG